jgi:type II secretory ATPase GspE/PulE/Tfp pilus assembly ATPase PilB-like protein
VEQFMPNPVLMAIEYGGYISIAKLLIFLALFFGWLALVGWVNRDAKAVETQGTFWAGLILSIGAAAAIVWMVVPIFIIGLLLYAIAIGATSLAYVKHRNTRVLDFERVLTIGHIKGLVANKEKNVEALKSFIFITTNGNEVPVPEPRTPDFFGYKTAYEILNDAMWRRASSIVFVPTPQDYNVTYHIDGAATKRPNLPKDQTEYLIRFLKQLADLDIKEKRKPQKGKFRIYKQKEGTDWEVTTAGSTAGEQIKLKQTTQRDTMRLSDIGLMSDQYEQINSFSQLKQGLFIISGPRNSGVTTTLYALLRNHDAFINNINTLEKKPSAQLPNITQNIFTLSDTGTTTYAKKLQTVVRMGPDIVGLADCEDSEVAQIACAAAQDGKLVYVTIKADSVVQALGKWIKMVDDRRLAAKVLLGISNQRLLRILCPECKQAYTPNQELIRKFNLPAEKAKVLHRPGGEVYDRRGRGSTCQHCQGTGFVGRTAVFEMIILDNELRKAVVNSKALSEIGTQFRRAKMLYLQEQALRKVISGTTAINEMVRVLSTSSKRRAKKSEGV